MKSRVLLVSGCFLFVASCGSITGQLPNSMSYEEIIAYNRTVDLWDEIHCTEEVRIGSHIPKRRCETLKELHGLGNSAGDTINTVTTGGPIF